MLVSCKILEIWFVIFCSGVQGVKAIILTVLCSMVKVVFCFVLFKIQVLRRTVGECCSVLVLIESVGKIDNLVVATCKACC